MSTFTQTPSRRYSTQTARVWKGGEQAPIAAQCTVTSDHVLLERVDRFTPKQIEWAESGRQNVVQRLYPRLLYSFSDTIVFVLDNPKSVACFKSKGGGELTCLTENTKKSLLS